ncbi:MAG: DUF4405 domain-containing protein [Chlorobium sp.]|nr:MAG: DUF4405 domain-containing protein [Chlorobium sp.]
MKTTLKSWATPVAAGAFTISSVTGLLIFFDIEIGMVEPVHKWLSWLLVSGILLHLISNWKQFTGYFSKRAGTAIIGAALLFTITSLLPVFGESEEEKEKENPGKNAAKLLESSSLETVALVVKSSPQSIAEQLGKNGIVVKNTSLTIREIAASNNKSERMVLGTILASYSGSSTKGGDRD